MKYFIPLILSFIFTGCTVEVPDYVSSLSDESTEWASIHADTTLPEIGVFAHYENGQLTASITCYCHPDSIDFIKDIAVSIIDFPRQNAPLIFTYGEFPGTSKHSVESESYTDAYQQVVIECDTTQAEQINFVASRTYVVAESDLPETIDLIYSITTEKWGTSTGTLRFKKTTREHQQVMRLH